MMKLWCYSRANAMAGHTFNDDVAICLADSNIEALNIFAKMYSDIELTEIREVVFNNRGIFVATDY